MSESPGAVVSLLGEAADHLDRLAGSATPGPWTPRDRGVCWELEELDEHDGTCFTKGDAHWIAALSPAVAPILAEWLRSTARLAATYTDLNLGDVYDVGAVQLARLVLRGTDSETPNPVPVTPTDKD